MLLFQYFKSLVVVVTTGVSLQMWCLSSVYWSYENQVMKEAETQARYLVKTNKPPTGDQQHHWPVSTHTAQQEVQYSTLLGMSPDLKASCSILPASYSKCRSEPLLNLLLPSHEYRVHSPNLHHLEDNL